MQRKTYFELHDATVVRPLSTAPAFSSQNQPLITILRSRFVTNKTAPRRPSSSPFSSLTPHHSPTDPFRAVLSSLFVFLCSATVLTASIQAALHIHEVGISRLFSLSILQTRTPYSPSPSPRIELIPSEAVHPEQIEREKADEEEQLGLDEEERKHPKGKGGENSEEERHHGVWHNIHDAKTAKVLRSLLEVDKDTVEGSFDFTIFGVPLVSFNSFSVSGHALLAITTEQPTSSVSVNFEDITQTIAGKARCVHVTSSSLGTVVTPSHWAGSFTQSQPLFDFVGCDSSLTSGHPFFGLSLLFYLLPVLGSRLGTRSFTQHRAFRVEYNICFFFPTLRVELTDTDTLCFTTIRIESCSLTGAPLLSLVLSATQHTNWDLNLKGISFAEESSNSVLSGALIFISGTSFATQLALSRFPPVYPVTDENKFW
ncbi:hypothetical protein BLNAU_18420 [Blattamonas nauphoetae]|uniref:Transmembrane protein n=1 Tax=Blattamonas nauphoetae TaxID=2049346 RepID=A0ABQ9X507_9EUKA|nr:hypothetical protein BLNAU_18420 [Blattamonas nauphoetae]